MTKQDKIKELREFIKQNLETMESVTGMAGAMATNGDIMTLMQLVDSVLCLMEGD